MRPVTRSSVAHALAASSIEPAGGTHALAAAQTDRPRFAAFDLLLDGEKDVQRTPYPARVARLDGALTAAVSSSAASWPRR